MDRFPTRVPRDWPPAPGVALPPGQEAFLEQRFRQAWAQTLPGAVAEGLGTLIRPNLEHTLIPI